MYKFNEFIEKYIIPIAGKLGSSRILTCLRDAFMLSFPLTIVGSIACVITNLPYINKIVGDDGVAKLNEVLGILPTTTMSMATLFVVMGIGYYFTRSYEVDAIFASAIGLSAFFVLTPLMVTTEGGETISNVIPIERIGAKGMFVGIIFTFLFTRLYVWAVKRNWTIKMPEGVPPTVAKSFAALVPGCIVLVAALAVRTIFTYTPWENIHDFIYKLVQAPLTSLGSGLGATLVAVFFIQILWFFGLHGQIIVNSVLDPIWNTLTLDNYEAYTSGAELPHIITKQFMETFTVGIGGTGMTLAIILAIFIVAKSDQMRGVAKLAAPAGVFNVNEPVIFGLPIVVNPTIIIPWVVAPMVVVTITYFAMKTGLVPYTTGVSVPWTVPMFFSGMLATQSIAGGLLQIINFVVVFVIWFPFIKALDAQTLKSEQANNEICELDQEKRLV